MTAPMCAEHRCPTRECEGVRLTRARRAPVCMCAHPKAVHQHSRRGMDCGLCGCRYYETARSVRYRDIAGNIAVLGLEVVIGGYLVGLAVGGVYLAVAVVHGVTALIGG